MNTHYQSAKALGTNVELCLVTGPEVDTPKILRNLWRYIAEFENRFSRFLPTSELSRLNLHAGEQFAASPEMRKLLSLSQRFMKQTDNLFNPFILPSLQKAGYVQSFFRTDHQAALDFSKLAPTKNSHIEISADWVRIPKGAALDLGGIAKGYLADSLADIVEPQVTGYWLSLGGDIIAGGRTAELLPWHIGIQSASSPSKDVAICRIDGQRLAIATSGIIKRRGTTPRGYWHHIIDPRTHKPAKTDVDLATVVCNSAATADVMATIAIINGMSNAPHFLKVNKILALLMQPPLKDPILFADKNFDGLQLISNPLAASRKVA